jgi:hypothetical protein
MGGFVTRSSDRRISIARKIEDEAPVSREAISIPPPSDSGPGPLERALEQAHDTIPTPPPESGIVDHVVIPPLKPIDKVC